MRIVARPARVSVCKEAAPHLLELVMRRYEPHIEVFVRPCGLTMVLNRFKCTIILKDL
jgi:hypothetical protein